MSLFGRVSLKLELIARSSFRKSIYLTNVRSCCVLELLEAVLTYLFPLVTDVGIVATFNSENTNGCRLGGDVG
jgi:hypothetical protein